MTRWEGNYEGYQPKEHSTSFSLKQSSAQYSIGILFVGALCLALEAHSCHQCRRICSIHLARCVLLLPSPEDKEGIDLVGPMGVAIVDGPSTWIGVPTAFIVLFIDEVRGDARRWTPAANSVVAVAPWALSTFGPLESASVLGIAQAVGHAGSFPVAARAGQYSIAHNTATSGLQESAYKFLQM